MDIKEMVLEKEKSAKRSARILAQTSTLAKNRSLIAMTGGLISAKDDLKRENEKDIAYAKENGLSPALIDRLTLNDKRIDAMASGIKEIIALPDPVGEVTHIWQRPNGIRVQTLAESM